MKNLAGIKETLIDLRKKSKTSWILFPFIWISVIALAIIVTIAWVRFADSGFTAAQFFQDGKYRDMYTLTELILGLIFIVVLVISGIWSLVLQIKMFLGMFDIKDSLELMQENHPEVASLQEVVTKGYKNSIMALFLLPFTSMLTKFKIKKSLKELEVITSVK